MKDKVVEVIIGALSQKLDKIIERSESLEKYMTSDMLERLEYLEDKLGDFIDGGYAEYDLDKMAGTLERLGGKIEKMSGEKESSNEKTISIEEVKKAARGCFGMDGPENELDNKVAMGYVIEWLVMPDGVDSYDTCSMTDYIKDALENKGVEVTE